MIPMTWLEVKEFFWAGVVFTLPMDGIWATCCSGYPFSFRYS